MEVIGADGVHVGHRGHHHFISLGLVAGIEGERVRLSPG